MKPIENNPESTFYDVHEREEDLDAPVAGSGTVTDPNVPSSPESPVETLLSRMQRSNDFPAFSQHVLEINQKASTSSNNLTSPSQLAGIILKDYSLTSKLLKLVNSAFYGNFAGNITTITKAVMVLGFKQVSLAASSLLLFDHLQSKTQSEELKDAAVSSFMSGLIARDLADKMGAESLEESFICAMLNNLGKHLAIFYLPDESKTIKSLIAKGGISERNAVWSVLGTHYEDIGMAVLTAWNFPTKIVSSLLPLPEGKVEKPNTDEDILRCLAGYSNELCNVIRTTRGNARTTALKALTSRFLKVVAVSEKQLSEMLNNAKAQMVEYSDLLGINTCESDFLQRLSMEKEPETMQAAVCNTGMPDRYDTTPAPEDHLSFLINGIQEITNALLSDYQLNDLMFMILETMYRGFDFNRVIFCMIEMSRTYMRARHAFGSDIDSVTGNFGFKISVPPTDLFNIALSQQRDIIVEDAGTPDIARLIPEWYQKRFLAPSFIIYPIIIKDIPFGLFYADKKRKGAILSATQLNYMKTLRNQSILAIKQKI